MLAQATYNSCMASAGATPCCRQIAGTAAVEVPALSVRPAARKSEKIEANKAKITLPPWGQLYSPAESLPTAYNVILKFDLSLV